jgi:hypothetical protein
LHDSISNIQFSIDQQFLKGKSKKAKGKRERNEIGETENTKR